MKAVAVASVFAVSSVSAASVNPVTRVVNLLKGIAKESEDAGKEDTKLYKQFNCWYKKTKKEKTASNLEAEARISELAQYIDEIKSGDHEFTSERTDDEKDLAEVNAQLEQALANRKQEQADFEAARDEMDEGIKALEGAIKATTEGAGAAFLSQSFDVKRALSMSEAVLSKDQYKTLVKDFDAPAPGDKDWEQLNKEGDFKNKYEARGGGIIATLQGLKKQFDDNRADAVKKNGDAKEAYNTLKAAKEDEKEALEKSLRDRTAENAARDEVANQSKAEKEALEAQVKADTQILTDAEKAFGERKTEFSDREAARAQEQAAISEAISILRADDARDTFSAVNKREANFFQLSASSNMVDRAEAQVMSTLRKAGDSKRFRYHLMKIQAAKRDVGGESGKSGIADVIKSIDDMVAKLDKDTKTDKDNVADCKSDYSRILQDMRNAAVSAQANEQKRLDNRAIEKAANEVIDKKNEEIAQLNDDKIEAQAARDLENKEFLRVTAENGVAINLLKDAVTSLKGAHSFLQQDPVSENLASASDKYAAGTDARKGSLDGVIAMIKMIDEDIARQNTLLTTDEKEALDAHNEFNRVTDASIKDAEGVVTAKEKEASTAAGNAVDGKKDRNSDRSDVEFAQGEFKDSAGHCNFYMLNIDARLEHRTTERDGLLKAKNILGGAEAGN